MRKILLIKSLTELAELIGLDVLKKPLLVLLHETLMDIQ